MTSNQNNSYSGTYIDLFSGCGGLSLGLGKAGWKGIFAVEKDSMAFDTFKHNMLDGGAYEHFNWPSWLPQQSTTIQNLIQGYASQLRELTGKVDLIAGGPPCQGFSTAGMRNPNDPRNQLFKQYIKMVEIIQPKYLILENVKGFNAPFKQKNNKSKSKPYSLIVTEKLEGLGYRVFTSQLNSEEFGVPQSRSRFIMIGIKNHIYDESTNPFTKLEEIRTAFLKNKNLPDRPISVQEAIYDLETEAPTSELVHHSGSVDKGFKKLKYAQPNTKTAFLNLLCTKETDYQPNGLRLPRHKPATIEKFKLIQKICRPGTALNRLEKEQVNTKKQVTCVLDKNRPSRTITTLPDDLIHYSEPRILTVRESARIQTFPDDFVFKGKYTTGGKDRTRECPKYTQVGNAVPPFLGEALGILIKGLSTK